MSLELKTAHERLPGPEAFNSIVKLDEIVACLGNENAEDMALVKRAYAFAEDAHRHQKRISGAPYFTHVSRVALSLAQLGLDSVTVAAALLHDTIEDTSVELETLIELFGEEVAGLVDGVTKISTRAFKTQEELQAENLRKMMVAMARDIRVLLIKLADRLHNMRTLDFLPADKQNRIARETLEVYAPLAHRLGIAVWKWELEDRCMAVLYSREYKELRAKIAQSHGNREAHLKEAAQRLDTELEKRGIKSEISGRSKHFWSVYQKVLNNHKKIDEVYDMVALRVVTNSVEDCYGAMGIIHGLWTPIPGRIKDYIARPKSNKYQSLHTTVIGPEGLPLEIQVRTAEMHRTAESGIAAHWVYKDKESKVGRHAVDLPFLENLLEWQRDSKDTGEFMEFLRLDLYDAEVFVFTPKGEVKVLPFGATAIDFAYAIHSKVGDQCYGSMVNGKMVPLRHELQSGDIVRVLTTPGHKPSKDWLHYVKTSKAKNRIRHALKVEQDETEAVKGRDMLQRELRRQKIDIKDLYKSSRVASAMKYFKFKEVDELLAAIGSKQLTPRLVSQKIKPPAKTGPTATPIEKVRAEFAKSVDRGVEVKGVRGVVVQFAKCCTPVYGDPVIGYITIGRGVSVHRSDCTNVADLSRRSDRLVEISWVGQESEVRPVELEVTAFDRAGLMTDMLVALAQTRALDGNHTAITAASAQALPDNLASAVFTVKIQDLDHLKRIMLNLYQVEGVSSVKRKDRRIRRKPASDAAQAAKLNSKANVSKMSDSKE